MGALGGGISRDPIEERGGRNIYNFINNDSINSIDLLGLKIIGTRKPPSRLPEISLPDPVANEETIIRIQTKLLLQYASFAARCCIDECSPSGSPRIDDVDVAIIPAFFSSPDQVDDAKHFVAKLHGLHIMAGITPSSSLMTTLETAYNITSSDMHSVFETALTAFSGNRSTVRLFTRVYFSTCEKERCWATFWQTKRYRWTKYPLSPTEWKEYTKGAWPPNQGGYVGLGNAEENVAAAVAEHVEYVMSRYGGDSP